MDIREKIVDLRVNHKLPLRDIAQRCGLSHERVRNILKEEGVDTKRVPKRPYTQTVIVEYNLDAQRIEHIYGCSLGQVRKIQKGIWLSAPHSPARLYNLHRKRYQVCPGWEMTLPQWWALWRRYWKHREANNLVMVPADSTQPMTPDNARIMTRKQLMELYWERRHGEQAQA
ncbi:hypothetical protein [Luteimonas sp. MC1750]|uniref:hypothetical protein n=1 Tax=Luteimonas sp. MC1750 TaxID=2799326 RepID=UPI0018F0D15E|nr:hypothetical protein [Luteimonas sp. MC1750]MBJ6984021.1 hypothetical protein [Luteimonas sp. MC1750]QQO06833.1 hypothetical protein JGR68_05245 [Luteimonas sp. MC1750]